MMATGEDDLICDLAETYGIYDMRALPARTIAILACGLRADSRTMTRIAEREDITTDTILLAKMTDYLALLVWSKTKDAQKGRNAPKSVTDILLHVNEQSEYLTYDTAEDFWTDWKARGGG